MTFNEKRKRKMKISSRFGCELLSNCVWNGYERMDGKSIIGDGQFFIGGRDFCFTPDAKFQTKGKRNLQLQKKKKKFN